MTSPIKNQINTIFVHVNDLNRSVKWYCTLLDQGYKEADIFDPVYNLFINAHTGLTLDAGPAGTTKKPNPSPYPLFNFHTEDVNQAYNYVKQLGIDLAEDIVTFDDFSFFTVKDPDGHLIMICTG